MGHCNSSTQLGSFGGFCADGPRADEAAASSGHGSRRERQTGGVNSAARKAAVWILLLLVRFYIAFLSPFLGGACKFHPSCSNYAYEAIRLHGAKRGLALAGKRLLRCRPFTKGGFDPVPENIVGVTLPGEIRSEAP